MSNLLLFKNMGMLIPSEKLVGLNTEVNAAIELKKILFPDIEEEETEIVVQPKLKVTIYASITDKEESIVVGEKVIRGKEIKDSFLDLKFKFLKKKRPYEWEFFVKKLKNNEKDTLLKNIEYVYNRLSKKAEKNGVSSNDMHRPNVIPNKLNPLARIQNLGKIVETETSYLDVDGWTPEKQEKLNRLKENIAENFEGRSCKLHFGPSEVLIFDKLKKIQSYFGDVDVQSKVSEFISEACKTI